MARQSGFNLWVWRFKQGANTGSNHRLMQIYKASMETSSKRPRFNSMGEAQRITRSLELLQVHVRQIMGMSVLSKARSLSIRLWKRIKRSEILGLVYNNYYNYCTCPARSKTCIKCHVNGHFATVCKTPKHNQEQKSKTKSVWDHWKKDTPFQQWMKLTKIWLKASWSQISP